MAITIWPWIIADKSERADDTIMNHERIHLAQEKELWVLPFYILYFAHSIWLFIRHLDFNKCYLLNFAELEAFTYQESMHYLYARKKFTCLKCDNNINNLRAEILHHKSKVTDRLVASFVLLIFTSIIIFLIIWLLSR